MKRKPKNQRDKNGNQHGEWLYYYNNSQLAHRWNWVHGIAHGLCEEYNNDGTLLYRGNYNMNKRVGYWFLFKISNYYLWLI